MSITKKLAVLREHHYGLDAVRIVHDEARKAGALGADIAIDALIAAKGGK
jgi:hypothetical protein